jgi:hypothetical protein
MAIEIYKYIETSLNRPALGPIYLNGRVRGVADLVRLSLHRKVWLGL